MSSIRHRRPAIAAYQTVPISLKRQPLASESAVLVGWKDIAKYLGKGVRTIQRYERQLSLPVRRPAGKPKGSVIVLRRELDEWLSATPTKPQPRARENPQPIIDLESLVFELRSLCAERRELRAALSAQRTALRLTIERMGKTLSELGIVKAERHRAIAAQQKADATEMRVRARELVDGAIQMRKPPQRPLVGNC